MKHREGDLGPIYLSKYQLCDHYGQTNQQDHDRGSKLYDISPGSRMGGDVSSSIQRVLLGKYSCP